LSGNGVEGFIPGDAGKPAFAAPASPFKWIHQAVGVVLPAQVSPPAGTRPQLGSRQAVRAVVGIQANDAAILNPGDE
jgi:hypothetical protein